jgi:hypothetical protein
MFSKVKLLAAALLFVVPMATLNVGCETPERLKKTDRWVTTENTNVAIDWDKVNEAYKLAEGPEDLEKRINEIYEGDEIISIAVQDTDASTQVVTGFFDKNVSGKVDEGEQIFTINRQITGEGTAQYQTTGHGAYAGYHSPFLSIMTGMLMGSMLSNMFMPSYRPMYTQPYTTPGGRVAQLNQSRSSYRAANPDKFQKSKSGRSYNAPKSGSKPSGGRPSGGRSGGGGRFGLARAGRTARPELLSA